MNCKFDYLVGLEWKDIKTSERFRIDAVQGNNILYSHMPGQGVISGGCYDIEAWHKRIESGQYVLMSSVILFEGCVCQRCGKSYKVDIIVSDELWKKIKPPNKLDGGGLLCGVCIMQGIENIGEFSAYELRPI